jgi:anti-sigma factor RsiW
MAFLDGELPAREAREVEARLDRDPVAKQQLEALAQLTKVVRTHYEGEIVDAEAKLAGLWSQIDKKLEGPASSPIETVRPAASGLLAYLADLFTPRTIGVGLVGVAAGALLMVALGRPRDGELRVSFDLGPAPVAAPVRTAEATQIEELEVQTGSAMVFQVPSENSSEPATTVVWVTGESAAEEPI